jgi:hypothetical protein
MFKQIIALGLLLACNPLKAIAQDRTELLIGEVKTQLGQKRAIMYEPRMPEFTIDVASGFCHYYNLYEQAYSGINKSVNKQQVKTEILTEISEQLKQEKNYEYIDRWSLEYYEAVIDSVLITNYCN